MKKQRQEVAENHIPPALMHSHYAATTATRTSGNMPVVMAQNFHPAAPNPHLIMQQQPQPGVGPQAAAAAHVTALRSQTVFIPNSPGSVELPHYAQPHLGPPNTAPPPTLSSGRLLDATSAGAIETPPMLTPEGEFKSIETHIETPSSTVPPPHPAAAAYFQAAANVNPGVEANFPHSVLRAQGATMPHLPPGATYDQQPMLIEPNAEPPDLAAYQQYEIQQQQQHQALLQRTTNPHGMIPNRLPPSQNNPQALISGLDFDVRPSQPQHGLHPQQYAYLSAQEGGAGAQNSSPSISRTPSQSSSRYSINQVINDHFDQYAIAANPAAQKMFQSRQQRYDPVPGASDSDSSTGGGASGGRRSTLATTKEFRSLLAAASNAHNNPPSTSASAVAEGLRQRFVGAAAEESDLFLLHRTESKTSLPDATLLDHTPVRMGRDEAARLSSMRREEIRRLHEEEELLRSNPLRYLFHPAVRVRINFNLFSSLHFFTFYSIQQLK